MTKKEWYSMGPLRNKSLVFTSSIMISIILLVTVTSMSFINYFGNKQSYFNQIEHQTKVLGGQVESQNDTLKKAIEQLSINNINDINFVKIQNQLDAMMISDPLLVSIRLISPQIEVREGKNYLKNIQVDRNYAEAMGITPGTEYEMAPLYQDAINQALKVGFARSMPISEPAMDITYVASFHAIKDGSGNTMALLEIDIGYSEIQKDLNQMLITSLGTGLLVVIIAIAIVIPVIMTTLRPLRQLADLTRQVAKGDLTVKIPIQNNNEIGLTAAAFNHMIDEIRLIITSIQSTSNEVITSVKDLQESAHQTAEASLEIAKSIQEVASGSELQLKKSDLSQSSMLEVINGINKIATSSQFTAHLAATTAEQAIAGDTEISKTVKQMQTIENELSVVAENMLELKSLSSSISEIMGLIRDVTNQTNLLALNASIEAARAGEAGKGFAVVATEIRKLAERSRESSEQIDEFLNKIIAYTEQTVISMEHSVKEAKTGTVISQKAGNTFLQIVQSIHEVSNQAHEVFTSAQIMSANSEQVNETLTELMRIAEDASLNSSRVAASSEEQAASMEEVSGLSEQLIGLVSTLNQAIKKFSI
jgi:methyl-accepting chemotaxis protein